MYEKPTWLRNVSSLRGINSASKNASSQDSLNSFRTSQTRQSPAQLYQQDMSVMSTSRAQIARLYRYNSKILCTMDLQCGVCRATSRANFRTIYRALFVVCPRLSPRPSRWFYNIGQHKQD